jgi:hypothetical protein
VEKYFRAGQATYKKNGSSVLRKKILQLFHGLQFDACNVIFRYKSLLLLYLLSKFICCRNNISYNLRKDITLSESTAQNSLMYSTPPGERNNNQPPLTARRHDESIFTVSQ